MDIKHLYCFIEVAKQSSFSKAGSQLHLSQPSISKIIRSLEEELGVELFERNTRNVILTDIGSVLLEQSVQVLQSMENLTIAIQDTALLNRGKLVLGIPPIIGSSFFAKVLTTFHAEYPNIMLKVLEEGSRLIEKLVTNKSVDVGVVVLPVSKEEFNVIPIIERELRLVVHTKHKLAGREIVNLDELQDEAFILFREEFGLHNRILEVCAEEGFEPKIIFEGSQWDFMVQLVAANFGVAFLPETIIDKLDTNKISIISTYPTIKWDIGLITRRDSYLSYSAREWIQKILHHFQ